MIIRDEILLWHVTTNLEERGRVRIAPDAGLAPPVAAAAAATFVVAPLPELERTGRM